MKRFFSSLPVILTLATIGALVLMRILVDDPADKPSLDHAAIGLESVPGIATHRSTPA